MKKAYRYRIYPTKKQEHILNAQLALCCELYNAALQERRDAYRMCGQTISFTQQSAQLPEIKAVRPEYEAVYSQVLQEVLHRVDKAFKAFFRRCKAGEKPGHPRYKSRPRYDSLTYPQRAKRRKVVARVHERIRWRRENFVQQESRRLVNRFGLIALEALVVRNMVKRPKAKQEQATGAYLPNGASRKVGLNKSIADAA